MISEGLISKPPLLEGQRPAQDRGTALWQWEHRCALRGEIPILLHNLCSSRRTTFLQGPQRAKVLREPHGLVFPTGKLPPHVARDEDEHTPSSNTWDQGLLPKPTRIPLATDTQIPPTFAGSGCSQCPQPCSGTHLHTWCNTPPRGHPPLASCGGASTGWWHLHQDLPHHRCTSARVWLTAQSLPVFRQGFQEKPTCKVSATTLTQQVNQREGSQMLSVLLVSSRAKRSIRRTPTEGDGFA